MLILDIVVIYIACGAPFAAAAFLDRCSRPQPHHLLASVATLLYWPALVPSTLRRVIGRTTLRSDSPGDVRTDSTVENLQSKLLDAWSQAFGSVGMNKFREKLERYSALSIELSTECGPGPSELAAIVGHVDPALNGICRARLNLRKLELHQTNARIDLIDAVDRLLDAGQPDVRAIATRLAGVVGDRAAVEELEAFPAEAVTAAA